MVPNILEALCSNLVENAAKDLTLDDLQIPRLNQDWMTHEEKLNREQVDMNLTIQNRVKIQLERQEQRNGRINDSNKQRCTTLIQPPIVNENSVIDLVDSDDEHEQSHYPSRDNREG